MSTEDAKTAEQFALEVRGLSVEVVRKDIRNVHLSVYPPAGQVRLAVPLRVSDEAARLAVVDRLAWIRRQQRALAAQPRQSKREMVTGESHYVWGQRCRLSVVRHAGANRVAHSSPARLDLYCRPGADAERRRQILADWRRAQLKARIPPLIAAWEPKLGVEVAGWGVRQMKTKWGSCTVQDRRVWLNLELAKKPPPCLEYLVVHEMTHLLERHHNDHFRALMDKHLPQWPLLRDALNQAPLAHEAWSY